MVTNKDKFSWLNSVSQLLSIKPVRSALIVLGIPLLATTVQWSLWGSIYPSSWFLYWPSVFFCIYLSTLKEGVVAIFLAAACAWWFFVPEPFTFIKQNYVAYAALIIFVSINIFACYLYALMKRSRARLDAKLSKVNATHNLLLTALDDGVFIAQDYKFVFCNPAFPKLLGYSATEFINSSFYKVVAPEYLSVWTERFEQRIAGISKPISNYEVQFQHRDGHYVWIELRANVASYRDRPAVMGVARDITARKKQEEQLHLASAIFQNTQEGVAVTDLERKILVTNPAFNLISEYGTEDLIGHPIDFLYVEDKNKDTLHQIELALKVTGAWQGEVWKRRKGGDIYREWLAVSTIRKTDGEPFQLIYICLDVSRMQHVETYMEHLSQHDSLTDLPNRSLLYTRLNHSISIAKRDHKICAVLFLDLDRFKPINDEYGHAVGDEVLIEVAKRMRSRMRDVDTVARLGGDEFVVVIGSIDSSIDALNVAEELIATIESPVTLASSAQVSVGASIGVSLFPSHADNAAVLLEKADIALYEAKRAGRARCVVYEVESLNKQLRAPSNSAVIH